MRFTKAAAKAGGWNATSPLPKMHDHETRERHESVRFEVSCVWCLSWFLSCLLMPASMTRFSHAIAVPLLLLCVFAVGEDWPQFRGPQSSGVAVPEGPLPTDIGPDKHVIWKTELPPGHSSPAI